MPLVGRRLVDAAEQAAPQLGLPQQVGVEGSTGPVGVARLAPVDDQRRPLDGVGREQAGQPTGDGVAAVAAELAVVTFEAVSEVGGQRGAPRLAQAVIDDRKQRPDQAVGVPRVVAVAAEQHRDEGTWVEEPHAGADPVAAGGRRTQPVRESLGQPPLDPFGRDDDDLLGERVVERSREQVAQRVGEHVGALGRMHRERHPMPPHTSATGSNLEPAADV